MTTASIKKQIRNAKMEATLLALLQSPKTRAGLVAVAKLKGMTANFVYGWLSRTTRLGTVTKLKSGERVEYVNTKTVPVQETPAQAIYPPWLDPRTLPQYRRRDVHLCSNADDDVPEEKEEALT